jgi:hypothetical protein
VTVRPGPSSLRDTGPGLPLAPALPPSSRGNSLAILQEGRLAIRGPVMVTVWQLPLCHRVYGDPDGDTHTKRRSLQMRKLDTDSRRVSFAGPALPALAIAAVFPAQYTTPG